MSNPHHKLRVVFVPSVESNHHTPGFLRPTRTNAVTVSDILYKLACLWEERDSNPPTASPIRQFVNRADLQSAAVILSLFKFQCSLILWLWLDSNQRGVLPHQFCRLLPSPLGTHSHYFPSKLLLITNLTQRYNNFLTYKNFRALFLIFFLQGHHGSNAGPSLLESDILPTELYPSIKKIPWEDFVSMFLSTQGICLLYLPIYF